MVINAHNCIMFMQSLEERVITLFNNDNNNVFKAQITII